MRKIFALLAVAFGVMSCQTDVNDFGANVGGEQDVNILVSLPDATRASENGAFGNVDFAQYDIEYFFQVFDATNDDNWKAMQTKVCDDKEVSFPVRLIAGRDYRFVVWAHLVDAAGNAHYTVGETLKDITLNENSNWVAMDDTRDAYTGVKTATFTGASDIAIELTRPFAKLRVVTTDMEELLGVKPVSAVVDYSSDTKFYTSFDALAQTPAGKVLEKEHTYAIKSYGETGAKKTLFADYFFAKDGDAVKFNIVVTMSDGKAPIEHSFTTEIPVNRNTLTTIEGNILTVGDDITVSVDDAFAAENIVIEGEYTLTADMEVDRPIVVLAGTEAVIDLNGFDIINTNASETFGEGEGIIAYGDLTIKGNGTVKGSTMAVWARGTNNNNNVTITIEGGNFEGCAENFAKGGRSVVYASSGNVINIKGGTFKALAADKTSYANKTEGVYAALNVADNNGMINVYGGSFYKQNPAAPGTEPAAWNANHPNGFLAEGCVAEADGDWFKVKYDPYYYHTKVSTADDLTEALANSQSKIYLVAGKVFEGTFAPKVNTEFVSDSENKATIKGRVNTKSFDISFENIKFACLAGHSDKAWVGAGATAKGHEAIVMIENAASSFENCNFDIDATYVACGINNHSAAESSDKLTVNNCTFAGNMYAIKTRTHFNITNSTFDIDGPDFTIYSVFTWGVGFPASAVFSNNRNLSGADDYIGGVQFISETHGADIYNNLTIIMNGNSDFIKDAGFNTTKLNYTNSTYNGVAIK